MFFPDFVSYLLNIIFCVSILFFIYELYTKPKSISFGIKAILRKKQITLITFSTIFVCTLALLTMGGYFQYSFWGLSESTIRGQTGHFQIFKEGYNKNKQKNPWDFKIENFIDIKAILEKDSLLSSKIKVILPVLDFNGLLTNGELSTTFVGRAVDPEADRKLSSFGETINKGSRFSEGDFEHALLGKGLCQTVDCDINSALTILSNSPNSGMSAADIVVKGITESFSSDYDNVYLKITLDAAWEMFNSRAVDKILVLLDETEDLASIYPYTRDLLKTKGFDLEYKSWRDLADFYVSVENLYTNIFRFFSAVLVVFSVLFLSSIFTIMLIHRKFEIALLRSYGNSIVNVIRIIMGEILTLSLLGVLLSAGVSLIIIYVFNINGIESAPPPGSNKAYVIKLRVLEEPRFIFDTMKFVFVTVILSSLYPLYSGSKANIIETLRKG